MLKTEFSLPTIPGELEDLDERGCPNTVEADDGGIEVKVKPKARLETKNSVTMDILVNNLVCDNDLITRGGERLLIITNRCWRFAY